MDAKPLNQSIFGIYGSITDLSHSYNAYNLSPTVTSSSMFYCNLLVKHQQIKQKSNVNTFLPDWPKPCPITVLGVKSNSIHTIDKNCTLFVPNTFGGFLHWWEVVNSPIVAHEKVITKLN